MARNQMQIIVLIERHPLRVGGETFQTNVNRMEPDQTGLCSSL
jgi:hypothetical protein